MLTAILIAPFKALWVLLSFLLHHKALIIIVGIVVIGIVVWSNHNRDNDTKQQVNIPAYQRIAPDKKLAPLVIQTFSRVYYAAHGTVKGDNYIIDSWWDYDKDTWQKHETPLPFKTSDIKIIQR